MQTDSEIMPDAEHGAAPEVVTDGALVAITRGEIGAQVETAKRFPRSLARFEQKLLQMATYNKEIAEGMFYTLERKDKEGGKKLIVGPSIRLAEAAAQAYTNMRCGARVIGEDDRFITTQGVAHDIENNVFVSIENRRRITNRSGAKFNDDMVGVTANASCSISLRNAIMRLVPRPVVDSMVKKCQQIAKGDGKDVAGKVQAWLAFWKKAGISEEQVCRRLDVVGVADLTLDHCVLMKGLQNRINDGEVTVDEAFGIKTTGNPEGGQKTTTTTAKPVIGATPQAQGATITTPGGNTTPGSEQNASQTNAGVTGSPESDFKKAVETGALDVFQLYRWLRKNEFGVDMEVINLESVVKTLAPKQIEWLLGRWDAISADVRDLMAEAEAGLTVSAPKPAEKPNEPGNVVPLPAAAPAPAAEPAKPTATGATTAPETQPAPAPVIDESPLGMLRTKTKTAGLTEDQVVDWARTAKKIAAGVSSFDGIIETSPSVVNYLVNNFAKIEKAIKGGK